VRTYVCDRCKTAIGSNPSIIKPIQGPLWAYADSQCPSEAEGWHLCGECGTDLLAWLEAASEKAAAV
jgi:hypothetical protein